MLDDIKGPTAADLQAIEDIESEVVEQEDVLLNGLIEGVRVDEYDGGVYNSRRIFGSRIA